MQQLGLPGPSQGLNVGLAPLSEAWYNLKMGKTVSQKLPQVGAVVRIKAFFVKPYVYATIIRVPGRSSATYLVKSDTEGAWEVPRKAFVVVSR